MSHAAYMLCYTSRNEKILLSLVLATAATVFAGSGEFTIERIEPFDYYDGNGWNATGQQIGPFYYFDGSDANSHHFGGTGEWIRPFYHFDADSE